jgi:hypothetical protein
LEVYGRRCYLRWGRVSSSSRFAKPRVVVRFHPSTVEAEMRLMGEFLVCHHGMYQDVPCWLTWSSVALQCIPQTSVYHYATLSNQLQRFMIWPAPQETL